MTVGDHERTHMTPYRVTFGTRELEDTVVQVTGGSACASVITFGFSPPPPFNLKIMRGIRALLHSVLAISLDCYFYHRYLCHAHSDSHGDLTPWVIALSVTPL